jgi:hypothetical protein
LKNTLSERQGLKCTLKKKDRVRKRILKKIDRVIKHTISEIGAEKCT